MPTTLQHATAIHLSDVLGPAFGALVFVLLMSLFREPTRKSFNAIFVAGACGVYLSGGFGVWEVLYPAIATPIAFTGLRSYRSIGIAWLMHSCWDIAHHLWGNPIWPFMPTSSFGCMIFDAVIAIWFIAGAPPILQGLALVDATVQFGPLRSPVLSCPYPNDVATTRERVNFPDSKRVQPDNSHIGHRAINNL